MYLTSEYYRGKMYVSELRIHSTVESLNDRLHKLHSAHGYMEFEEWLIKAGRSLRVYELVPDSPDHPVLIRGKKLITLLTECTSTVI